MRKTDNFDNSISFIRFLEMKNYNFGDDMNTNPLTPLYPIYKSDINLPLISFTDRSLNICNKIVNICPNTTDKKPVNCLKVFNYSKKLIYGTSNGNLIIYDTTNFSFSNKLTAHASSVRAIQFTKTENYLLTGDNTGNIVYFDSMQQQVTKLRAHNDKESITDISFSISDTKFITSSDDKTSKIFDLSTGLEEFIFTGKNYS